MSITWNREAAAHLARRAGFGATPSELDQYTALGLDATVDRFVNFDGIDNGALETELTRLTTIQPGQTAPAYDLTRSQGMQKWFLHRMVHTARPLEEKMTYFWNQIFTSSFAKVEDATLMLNQNRTQRTLAVARFDDLVLAMTKDPAMLIWLDNRTSTRNRPNETWSEFGRRVPENGSLGTDHGTAGVQFLIGSGVNRGIYGERPNLSALDRNGNLSWQIDFRSYYGSVLQDWMRADAGAILGAGYPNLGCVNRNYA